MNTFKFKKSTKAGKTGEPVHQDKMTGSKRVWALSPSSSGSLNAFYSSGPTLKLTGTIKSLNCLNQRCSKPAKTFCDIEIHPKDTSIYLHRPFRVVGKGEPKIVFSKPGLKDKMKGETPCLFEATMVHENKHVKNSSVPCKNLKKCLDKKSSKPLGGLFGGEPRISYIDFVKCHNLHNNGLMKDCITDEKQAYEAEIQKAIELKKQKRCAKEIQNLDKQIGYWERIKNNAPNCKTRRNKP